MPEDTYGLRSTAAVEGDRVGGVVAEIGGYAVLEPVARAQQDDEHENAPRDRALLLLPGRAHFSLHTFVAG